MSQPLETISASAKADDARSRMRLLGVHHLAVLDGRRVAGVISDRDLGGRRPAAGERRTVAELMTGHVVTGTPQTTVRQAANLLRGRNIGCLPVVDDGRAVGIVTVSDLLELVGRGSAGRQMAANQRWTLRGRGPRQRPRGEGKTPEA